MKEQEEVLVESNLVEECYCAELRLMENYDKYKKGDVFLVKGSNVTEVYEFAMFNNYVQAKMLDNSFKNIPLSHIDIYDIVE